ncbi:MAG: D-aminoacyl-tRNA deacylase [Pseudonocardiales bacterium]|jgi:D-tyrosyl-tRNA(Tyr) deacylase|nr:D-aminoacyl-tRNA deacylase [Pseudonocardiales bacterium]
MRAVLTRVTSAEVAVEGHVIGRIGPGLLALIGVTHSDDERVARSLAAKIAGIRILRDGDRDESSALQVGAEVLVVSQFTLYADVSHGRRPSWSGAAPGPVAEPLVQAVLEELRRLGISAQSGRFGARMAVSSVNDGPLTILIDAD